jgi:type IV pilus assembly protein PilM
MGVMMKSKTFLGVDFGAGSLKVAEFEEAEGGGLRLLRFAVKPLGLAGSQDAARENVLRKAIPEVLAEGGFVSRQANLCAPGYQVFSKFVKLPPVDTSKVTQIIQYEAQQNVPFPLAETAWDYQILGANPAGELEVLLLAIKSDAVDKLFNLAEAAGLKMEVVDGSVAALCNAFRFNYTDLDGCSLLIDIGAKTSSVLLFEKNKFYARGINVGANSITQEFAAEVKLPFVEAEKIKVGQGFVGLGGAYEEPDDPRVAAVSKVARNVLTRLHLQVNQTVQFYRTQQGGAAPVRVFLCGGGSLMPYAAEFFQEKLNLPVDIFNPFRNIQIDPGVDVAELEKVAQCFGEVVGLGLRNIAQCPVELNLMPRSSRMRQEFNSKKPYLVAAAYALVVGVFAYGFFYSRVAAARQIGLEEITTRVDPLQRTQSRLMSEESQLRRAKEQADQYAKWLEERTFWADVLREMRRVMLTTEGTVQQRLGVPVGVWIESMSTSEASAGPAPVVEDSSSQASAGMDFYKMDPVLARRYGLIPPGAEGGETGADPAAGGYDPMTGMSTTSAAPVKTSNSTNEVAYIDLRIRAVNLIRVRPQANSELAYELEREMKNSPLFEANETQLTGNLDGVDENAPSFSFPLKVRLKRPMEL